jgi:hypothetical protein
LLSFLRLRWWFAASVLILAFTFPAIAKADENKSNQFVDGPRDVNLFNVEPTAMGEPHDLALHVYVSKKLEDVALNIESNDSSKALLLLNKKKLTDGFPVSEFHYLKALCLQSMKQFPKSLSEYDLAANDSTPAMLQKAKLGAKLATERIFQLQREQLYFPRTTFVPDVRPNVRRHHH